MISMTKYRGHEILPDDLLLGQEDLGRHGAEIAKNHNEVENRAFAGILLRRLTECMKKIDDVHEALNENQDSAIPMPPAGEWLLDNHYLIQEQAEMVEHFLKGCRGTMLPALMGGRMKGYPRIYAVALELVAHTDGAVDEKSLIHFIKSYQANQGLSMGELWSLSGMLRLSLVEKIRLLCGRLEVTLNQKNNAENLLRQMLTEDTSREDKWLDLSGLATGVLHPSFVEHLSRGLRKKGYPLSVMDQLEVRLEERDQDIAGVIEREHGNQAGMQASLGNAVTSLRIMGEMDWTKLFEELSQVEQILRGDPSGVYKEMDPQSRQLYRSKVHKLASVCHVSEMSVAKRAVEWAGKAGKDSIEGHVGYHLAGRGAQLFKDSLGRRRADHRTGSGNREEGPSADHRYGSGNSIDRSERAGHRSSKNEMASMKTGRKIPFQVYAGTILAVAAVITAALCYYAAGMGEYSIPYAVAMTALLVVLPAADVATRLVNLGAAFLVKPEILPKMELEGGIPENLATMVILPTLLTSVKRGKDLVRSMETIYLANREEHLYFALLGDFKDSQEREMPEDARIAEATLAEIRSLNSKYSKDGKDRFYYFNRRREFNEKQSSWMGWERKRGAILEFNELLLEEAANKEANINNSKDGSDSKEMNNFPAGKDSVAGKVSKAGRLGSGYTIRSSGLEGLPPVRYVITLDADTTLPIDGGRKLVGCLSHPLNSPVMEEGSEVVKEGYGILQPRVGVTIHAANGSLFSKIFAGAGGQDPYTTAVSDVYQDLFGEGIFTGKGIYDLEVFQKILRKSIGDNKVLSHDLLEGSFVRAGLVTDILLMDGYPSRYNGWAMRLHRWVRGDWQLLPWLLPDITNGCEEKMVNPLSGLSRWKIADNMRRSLTTPATLALLTIGPFLLPGHFSIWMGLALLDIFHALWGAVLNRLLAFTKGVGRAPVEPTVMAGLTGALLQGLLNLSFLPYEAFLLLGAITRTLYRVLISHRNMLQWVTAADMEACLSNNLGSFIKRMWVGGALGLSFAYLAFLFSPGLLIASILLLSIWSGAPMLAYFISLPARVGNHPLSTEEAGRLRRDGRKIWAFYEDFAGAGDNYLPPDNYQEEPVRRIAHRTSPTNMGFMLLGILNARDLGYIGTFEMLQRLDRVLGTMEKLERWKGHFFNWYDTTTLEVLKPGYISTVDSGNLAGYLLVLEQAMEEYANRPALEGIHRAGIQDLLKLHQEEVKEGTEPLFKGMPGDALNESNLPFRPEDFERELETMRKVLLEARPVGSSVPTAGQGADQRLEPSDREGGSERRLLRNSYWGGKLTEKVEDFLQEVRMDASEREDIPSTCRSLRDRVVAIYEEMDFAPLYEKNRQLFSIGYNTEEGRLTGSYYDLLASEARLTSYIAIAGRSVDRSHWTKLGRRLGCADGAQGLLSWTGTMFEYLMPCLVMKSYENTLLAQAAGFALTAQKAYASRRGIPWGISESGYHEFDISLNYQYKAFGIPELGLKRGLHREVVVSPYSTMLALGMDTHGAQENLERLRLEGMEGRYGFYEALDFTPGRAGRNGRAQVKSYMAHHQGMSLAALNNLLGGNLLQERFHRNPVIRSADELLQEKITRVGSSRRNHRVRKQDLNFKKMVGDDGRTRKEGKDFALRKGEMPQGPLPRVHLLTNGAYSLMINDGGSGYSKLRDIMVCRWQGGSGAVAGGQYVFIQNLNSNEAWSATLEPMLAIPDSYHTVFSPDKAEFVRRDGNIEARTEIAVSPEDNAEIRRITLTNHSEHTRELQLTSYFEIVLTTGEADAAHPSFSNLFVMTEFLEDKEALLAVRRPRDGSACKPWLIHTAVCEGKGIGGLQYETDRMKFIGRNRNLQNPAAMDVTQPLSNSAGASIDPVMSLRRRVILGPGQSANVVFVTALGETREEALEMADKYRNPTSFTRAFMLSRTRCDIEGDYLGLNWEEVREYLEALSHLLYNSPSRRLIKDSLAKNRKGQPGLWQYGISGDRPVMLLTLHDMADVEMAVWGLKATEFWRSRGIRSDLLLLVFEPGGYAQPLLDACREALSAAGGRAGGVKRDGIFILNGTQLPEEDILLFHAASSLVLKGGGGAVGEQLGLRLERTEAAISVPHPSDGNGQPGTEYPEIRPAFKSGNAPSNTKAPWPNMEKTVATLQFYNGLAGFSQDGKEYVIFAGEGHRTPAPWINVISNPGFGFCISESGGGYTWAENSRENKLTPWSNDPVMDPPGEILYLRDEEDGAFWSLTPQPAGGEIQYEVRHGMGYTIFKHETGGLGVSLTVFAAGVDPVKLWMIRINNLTGRDRKVSAFYYIRPVLGERPGKTSRTIVTESGDRDGMIFITNTFSHDFPGRVAFIGSSEITAGSTGDEMEFIGRNGSLQNPKALSRARLSGALGAGYEPCAALQTDFVIEKEKEKKLLFIIGQGRSKEEATELAARYGRYEAAEEELRKIAAGWEKRLTALQVETPDPSMNILLNGWLLYQVTSCRLWGRSAFYQSGGAYGFRDQLQDVTALIYACPDTVKKQLLHHAGHQFPEGDVQHWWHEESGKGIRTRYSDDLVWLPYVVADYIEHTGDWDILDSRVGYLSSEPLPDGEDERYEIPGHGQTTESLYLHCIRALERALRFGEHGIPLMGCGDWNDGMNRVGNKGRGESVWLGWFLITVLKKFIPICRNTGDEAKATDFENAMNSMSTALEKSAWDGSWYRRAYFDDGKPLGASANSECQIDSISQSWAVISGVCRKARTDEAMNAADSYLVDRENGLIRLLTPPFDKGDLEPGYIKGYIPGVRENGGQYTHAAVWLIIAHALRGDGDKAWELYHMVNPINHGRTAMECGKYRVEPYVMSADVYGYSPHAGRGGWSWYTGAAAWMYRAGIEHMLGLRKRGGELTVVPCIPKTWKGYVMDYRYGSATYRIKVENPGSMNKGVVFVSVDEKEAADGVIPLKDDGDIHEVRVVMG